MSVERGEANHESPNSKVISQKYGAEFPYDKLRLSCSDESLVTILTNLTTKKVKVGEIEFDVLCQNLQKNFSTNSSQRSVRELLCKNYVDHLETTLPSWRKTKEVLYEYPGISEEWQLFDPYNSVFEYINRQPDDSTPKTDYPVVLVFPRTFEKRASVLSQAGKEYLGFEELKASLDLTGYRATILNAEQRNLDLKETTENLISLGARVVGINATAMTINDGLKVAQACKNISPSTFVVLGGHHMSLAAQEEDIFKQQKFKDVDAVIVGKGDLSLPLLIDELRRGETLENIPDLITRSNPQKKITNAWRAIPLSKAPQIQHVQLDYTYPKGSSEKGLKTSRMSTSEGCIGNCSFCTSVELYDRKYNPRHVRQIVDEMEYLNKKYGIETVYFNDDIFIKPGIEGLERANAFCDELQNRNLKMQFRPLLRPDSIPPTEEGEKLLKRLHEAGMSMAFIGFESASQEMLNMMGKLSKAENYSKFVQSARKEGITLQLGFIAWHPLMSIKDASQNFQFLRTVNELYNFSVMVQKLDIFPGTRDKLRMQQKGLLSPNFDCTSDSQDYQFADPKIGKLANILNAIYKEDKMLEEFDSHMANIHLTKMPELMQKMTKLLKNKPTAFLKEGILHLQNKYSSTLEEVNEILFNFINEHLSLYDDTDGALEITRNRLHKTLPKLNKIIDNIENEIEFIETTCLTRPNSDSEIENIFSWKNFPDRISDNVAISEYGVRKFFEKLLESNVKFKIITDQEALRKVEEDYPDIVRKIKDKCEYISKDLGEENLHKISITDEKIIIGLGGGTVMDLAKYTSYDCGIPIVLIPTILSTNTFSSPYIHPLKMLKKIGVNETITGRLPDFVVVDTAFLSNQDQRLNRLGYGDLIAIASASKDWKLSWTNGQTKYNKSIEEKTTSLLRKIEPANINSERGIRELAESLTWLSYCTIVKGVGSHPASGSEKIFSTAALELFPDKVNHGEMMALGTLIMTYLQSGNVKDVAQIIDMSGINLNLTKLGLTIPQLTKILKHSKEVSKLKGRVTILDNFNLDHEECERIVGQLMSQGIILQ